MKNIFTYIKKFLKVLIWPILFLLGNFLIQYIFVSIFNKNEKGTMNDSEFLNHIQTEDYISKLNEYITSKTLVIILIVFIIFLPLLYKKYKKYKELNIFNKKDIFIPIILGICISLIHNIIWYSLNYLFNFTNIFEISKVSLIIQIISSGILGPILEELMYRGIVYNKLKEFNNENLSTIITSILFALSHNNIINGIYAFFVSFILIYLYKKYKTLKAPILMHIALNVTVILILPLIVKNNLVFNLYLMIVSVIVLFYLMKGVVYKWKTHI